MYRLRGGSAGAARGAASFLTKRVSRVRNAGATGPLTVRADSAFYSKSMLATASRFGVRFSNTARQDKGSGPRSSRSPRTPGSRSRTGCSLPMSPAPTSPRPRSPCSPATSATPDRSASSSGGSGPPPARGWRCSPPGTTTRSSPTGPCPCPSSKPTTARDQHHDHAGAALAGHHLPGARAESDGSRGRAKWWRTTGPPRT